MKITLKRRSATIDRSESVRLVYSKTTKRPRKSKNAHFSIQIYSVSKATEDFIVNVAKSVDGKTFTIFIKYLTELRAEVLDNPNHRLTPDSFLIFLDTVKYLSHSANFNDLIIKKMLICKQQLHNH